MLTIQQLVNRTLDKQPVIVDMLQQDIINIQALAERIHSEVEQQRKSKVTLAAVSMAIRRYTTELSLKPIFSHVIPSGLEVSTKSNIYEVAIEKSSQIRKIINTLYSHIKRSKGESLSVVEGTYEVVFFTNQSNKIYVKEALKNETITSEFDDLCYVTVNWETITKNIPGIYYRVTRELAIRGISMVSLYTIGAEMMVFVKRENLPEAYNAIENFISGKK